ncbi:MAG: sulfite exporter TauE/SafE family protein [Planctomycetes bacterium]|nr:sulfite exporter TauE/SafE family protein [Planctomycetota bacterium]
MGFSQLTFQQLGGAVVAGGAVGYLSGLFGVGGGFLLVPLLNIVLGIPIELAVGAGPCQVLGPATTSLLARRVGKADLRLPLIIALGLLIGVFWGARLLEAAKQQGRIAWNGQSIPLAELVVLSLYWILLVVLGAFSLWEVRRSQRRRPIPRGWIRRWRIPPYATLPDSDGQDISIPVVSWFAVAVGFLAGLIGTSGGLILLPSLIYLVGLTTHRAVLNTIVIVWIVAAQSTIAHAWHDNINLVLVMSLLLGGTIGARLGAVTSLRLGGRQLRHRFGWLLLGTAVLIALRLAKRLLL